MLPDVRSDRESTFYIESQCTYRCVVLPDAGLGVGITAGIMVSMHLQVRGAP